MKMSKESQTYRKWLKSQKSRNDHIGDLAKDAFHESSTYTGNNPEDLACKPNTYYVNKGILFKRPGLTWKTGSSI